MEHRQDKEQSRRNRLEMDVETYLELDKISKKIKYEYLDGYAYALAGGSGAHDIIGKNIYRILDDSLPEDGPCKPHGSDLKVAINEHKYVYPDAFVVCTPEDTADSVKVAQSPSLVIEVLSSGTEKEDRGEKFSAYQSIPSIHTYILVSTQIQKAEVYRRGEEAWTYEVYEAGETITVRELGIQLPVSRFYRRTSIPRS